MSDLSEGQIRWRDRLLFDGRDLALVDIQGWDDLRRRLAADRRCFGFFHPALPGEPLYPC
jgi:hypothetical protein